MDGTLVSSHCWCAQDRKEMYKGFQRACRAIVLLTKPFVWWHSCCRCRHGLFKLSITLTAPATQFEQTLTKQMKQGHHKTEMFGKNLRLSDQHSVSLLNRIFFLKKELYSSCRSKLKQPKRFYSSQSTF